MKCKWYAEFAGVCCNGDCKAHCADSCPFDGYAEDCKYGKEKKTTNFDRIKVMSVEELAKLLCYCSDCGNGRCYGDKLCTYSDGACNGLVKWLESEVQEDE